MSLEKPPKLPADGLFVYPHNLEAERAVLGAALIRTSNVDYIVDHLKPEHFYRRAHAQLFTALREMRSSGKAVDVVTLKASLTAKQLEAIGGPAYLVELTNGVPRGSNIAHYAGIVQDLSSKRSLAEYAQLTLEHINAGANSSGVLLADADRRMMDLKGGHTEGRMKLLSETQSELFKDFEHRMEHPGALTGVDTGFTELNALTAGWQPGDLVVIGARPSIGKTSFVLNSATAAARGGRRVSIHSLEMRRKQLEYRLLSSISRVPATRLLRGVLGSADNEPVRAAFEQMHALPMAIDDRGGQSVWDIRGASRRLKAEGGLDLIVVDYVQLMRGSLEGRGHSTNDQITDTSRRLKDLADEVQCPVLLLSQLTRSNEKEDRPPRLADLRESGALEQDADIVAFLHRKHHRQGGTTQLILEKQRNGPTGTLNLSFDRDTVTFTDGPAEAEEAPAPAPERKPKTYAQRYQKARES